MLLNRPPSWSLYGWSRGKSTNGWMFMSMSMSMSTNSSTSMPKIDHLLSKSHIKRLNHIAIAYKNIQGPTEFYKNVLQMPVSKSQVREGAM